MSQNRFSLSSVLPGLLLCLAVTAASEVIALGEARLFGRDWIEALVVAILLGVMVRSFWEPPKRFGPGIQFCGKLLLETAIVLLGASLSAQVMVAAGPALLAGIALVVVLAIAASYGLGRALGLQPKLAMLVACGNSICGNSAIAAAAPIIGASATDVAASIAFTAVLGVVVVLSLPLIGELIRLDGLQYGIFAGMTVYAVPQVLAATIPAGSISVQMGTLVKLVRVLMLGPVLLALGLIHGRSGGQRLKLSQVVPWYIIGFLIMAGLRSASLIPPAAVQGMAQAAGMLTVVAMAALGLSVSVRSIARAGMTVTATVILSLVVLGLASLVMIRLCGVA